MKEINEKEMEQILRAATKLARDRAKAAGTSIIYEENDKMIREYPDGRKMQVIRDEHGQRTEIDYSPS